MANVIKEGGLRLKKAAVDQPLMWCLHASGDSVRLGKGDPVKTAGDSGQAYSGGPYTKSVALCASGDPIYGVVEGVVPYGDSQNLDITYCAASTARYVLVRVANNSDVYAITEDGALSTADIGTNANLTGNGGGTTITACNTASGQSTVMLDTSTKQTTATLQVKMIGYEDTADNTPGSTNSSILVQLNNVESSGGTGTVGV